VTSDANSVDQNKIAQQASKYKEQEIEKILEEEYKEIENLKQQEKQKISLENEHNHHEQNLETILNDNNSVENKSDVK